MTDYFLSPCDVVVDFLRVRLTDPRDRAETSDTDSFSATSGQTTRTITPTAGTTVSCITTLTVEGTTLTKWQDYYWDYQNQKVTFKTALTLNDAVVITYKEGSSNWIFGDKPDDKLGPTSWPRIQVWPVSASGRRLGNYEAPVEGNVQMHIDIWSKNSQDFTISSRKYSNHYMTQYLGYKITEAFEDYENDLYPVLFDYVPISMPRAAGYSDRYSAYRSIVEASFNGITLGKITF